ncbi:30S ribosomal protein S6--L-glutamate ligase, partial [bacterium]|nr:30S ribosomal protein S6--L-glutamate ligase [bacterium]
HSSFYIQKYINKPGRDIRVLVIGDTAVCAIYRKSKHWITNGHKGAEADVCPVTDEIKELALKSARAVGGGILAVDIMEHNGGYLVIEINYTPEFRLLFETTGIDVAGMMVDYAMEVAKK